MKKIKSRIHFQLFLIFSSFCFAVFSSNSIASEQIEKLSLDQLFASLKVTTDEQKSRKLENQIWLTWLSAENDEIDSLINDAFQLRREFNLLGAVDFLNQIIEKVPHYSEAWNQRAIAYFYQGKLDLALKDIEKTLELEPRHFGAMAGRAVINLKLSRPDLARASIAEALKLHPFLPERTLFPDLYEKTKN